MYAKHDRVVDSDGQRWSVVQMLYTEAMLQGYLCRNDDGKYRIIDARKLSKLNFQFKVGDEAELWRKMEAVVAGHKTACNSIPDLKPTKELEVGDTVTSVGDWIIEGREVKWPVCDGMPIDMAKCVRKRGPGEMTIPWRDLRESSGRMIQQSDGTNTFSGCTAHNSGSDGYLMQAEKVSKERDAAEATQKGLVAENLRLRKERDDVVRSFACEMSIKWRSEGGACRNLPNRSVCACCQLLQERSKSVQHDCGVGYVHHVDRHGNDTPTICLHKDKPCTLCELSRARWELAQPKRTFVATSGRSQGKTAATIEQQADEIKALRRVADRCVTDLAKLKGSIANRQTLLGQQTDEIAALKNSLAGASLRWCDCGLSAKQRLNGEPCDNYAGGGRICTSCALAQARDALTNANKAHRNSVGKLQTHQCVEFSCGHDSAVECHKSLCNAISEAFNGGL